MSYVENSSRAGRVILPDLVRAFALMGIVLVNVAYFAYPADVTYHAEALNSGWDNAAYFAVNAFFLFKSYTLFSFMFGVGLAYQISAAERHGASFAPSYFRRMLGLLILGCLHVTVAFLGDILIVYAVLGVLLFLFKNYSQKLLMRVGIGLIVIQVLITAFFAASLYAADTYAPEIWQEVVLEMEKERISASTSYKQGRFSDVIEQRWMDWSTMIKFAMPMQGPGVFGFFLFGLAAVRAGVLSDPTSALWKKSRRIYLPIGLALSCIGALIYMGSDGPFSARGMLGTTIMVLGAPFSSIGYIGMIAKWSEGPVTRTKEFLARGGTASLTAYLLQSVILSLIFCGYGFGLYGNMGAALCVVLAFCTGLVTITMTSLWRQKYSRGPMESLLRTWTYFGERNEKGKQTT